MSRAVERFILERRKGWTLQEIADWFACSTWKIRLVANRLVDEQKVVVGRKGRARTYRGKH